MSHSFFDSRDLFYKTPFGAVPAGRQLSLRLRLPKSSRSAEPLLLVFEADRWRQPAAQIGLLPQGGDDAFDYFACSFTAPWPGLFFYCFEYSGENGRTRVLRTAGGKGRPEGEGGGLWQLTVYDPALATPAPLRGGVMYQIFPDRFRRGGLPGAQPPSGRTLREDWGGLPKYLPDPDGEYRPDDFFGGDLPGILQKLPYLAGLGVTALYLNPIFEAHANHRYNTADYLRVDPLLGEDADFALLCREAERLGISVLLDGVFSHTGSDSVYFNREGRYGPGGAYNDPQSPYFGWYSFTDYPDGYESWWGFETLPNVNETHPGYLEFICGPGGVVQKWMELGAKGWRLDVADELPDRFLDRFTAAVKGFDPQAAVVGEVWEDASNKSSYGKRRRYLLGGQLDSVMNYPLRQAILDFIRHGQGVQLYETLMTLLENYPAPVVHGLMNSLSTHDVPRAVTALAGPPMQGGDRVWQAAHHSLTPEAYARGRVMLMAAAVLQYTLPGLPCLYYGDEAGLAGYRDPFNRCCYPWGSEDTGLLDFFRLLGRLRSECGLLADADFLPLHYDDQGFFSYLRAKEGRAVYVAVNSAAAPRQAAPPAGFAPDAPPLVLSGYEGQTLAPMGAVVLQGSFAAE